MGSNEQGESKGTTFEDLHNLVKINSVIHNPARLAILLFLLPRNKESFRIIQKVLGLTAGNLSSHLKKLEQAGLVEVEKTFQKAKPITIIHLTLLGRSTVLQYVDTMSQVLEKVKHSKESQ